LDLSAHDFITPLIYICLRSRLHRAQNTLHLGYKNQPVNGVEGDTRCFSKIDTKHTQIPSVGRMQNEC